MVRFIPPSSTRLKVSLYLMMLSAFAGIVTSEGAVLPFFLGFFIWLWMEIGSWLYNHDFQFSALLADPRKARTRIAIAIPPTIVLGYLLFFQGASVQQSGYQLGVGLGFDLAIVWLICEGVLKLVDWQDRRVNGVSCGEQIVAAYEQQVSEDSALHPFKDFINTLDI